MKKEIADAAKFIVRMRTLPAQIDYVSPSDKAKLRKAEELIESIQDPVEKKEAEDYIENMIDSYYDVIPGTNYSPADLADMF